MSANERETAEASPPTETNGTAPLEDGMLSSQNGATTAPTAGHANPPPRSEEKYRCLIQRRIELILKRNRGGGITPEETAELDGLEGQVRAYAKLHHPLPSRFLREIEDLARSLGVALPSAHSS